MILRGKQVTYISGVFVSAQMVNILPPELKTNKYEYVI